jgi:hypothetical protein
VCKICLSFLLIFIFVGYSFGVLEEILTGFVGIQKATNDWMVTTAGATFIEEIRTQPPTIAYNTTTGAEICSNATDDDGTFPLWTVNTTSGLQCVGDVYSDYDPSGSDFNVYGGFVYDATVTLIESIIGYCKVTFPVGTSGDWEIPEHVSGTKLAAYTVKNTDFDGVTGKIRFSVGEPLIADYGFGDRTWDVNYQLVCFQNQNDTVEGFDFRRFGTWRSEGGFTYCTEDPALQSELTGGCTPALWRGVDFSDTTLDDRYIYS